MSTSKALYLLLLFTFFIGMGLFLKNDILNVYETLNKDLQNFQKKDLIEVVNEAQEIKKIILNPKPLNIGGAANQVNLVKEKIIAQTNIHRYNNGLPPVIENAQLDLAAQVKAKDMFTNQYFEHVSPSGMDPGELVKMYNYDYIVTGENLILGNFKDEREVVQLWMDSPGHRANILNERFADIGVAVIKGTYNGQTVWIGVQEFGLSLNTCKEPNTNIKKEIDSNKNALTQLESQINSKKEEIDNTDRNSPQYNALVDEYNELVNKYNILNQATKNLILQYNNQVNSFNQCVAG